MLDGAVGFFLYLWDTCKKTMCLAKWFQTLYMKMHCNSPKVGEKIFFKENTKTNKLSIKPLPDMPANSSVLDFQ